MPVLTPNNFLQSVATYQPGLMAYLLNSHCFIDTTNKQFLNFQDEPGQLGQTVTFSKVYRFTTADGLIAQVQPITQRPQTLVVDTAFNTSASYTSEQQVFNLNEEQYFKQIGQSAVKSLGTKIESDVATAILDHTYRFYGNGISPINSFGQLSSMLALFEDYGAANFGLKGYLQLTAVPEIVNSGLGQFAIERNNQMQKHWMVGDYANCQWYKTQLLPKHTAGTVGNSNKTSTPIVLTVTGTNDPTGQNITQIMCSGAPVSDPLAIVTNDLMQFEDGVTGQPPMRYLRFMGYTESENRVQIRSTATSISDGSGNVTINIFPALQVTAGQSQNINHNVVAGMQIRVLPSHTRGLLVSGDAFYLAMPKLPEQHPYYYSSLTDEDSGASIRLTMGSRLGENLNLIIYDSIHGKTLVDENAMAIIFPS